MSFDPEEAEQKYKQMVWGIVIANGGALDTPCDDIDYYGACLNADYVKTQEMLAAIRKSGIDWQCSSDPASHVGDGFNGTFASRSFQVPYLKGTLVLNDGQEFTVGVGTDPALLPTSFSAILEMILNDLGLENALSKLEDRLTSKHIDAYNFKFSCNIR
jgi:hypothetical protein